MKTIHKKTEHACLGYYTLEHMATGKRYTAVAKNMQQEILETKGQLKTNTHACGLLQWLYNRDDEYKVRCVATATLKDARAAVRAYRAMLPKHLLIN